MRVYRPGVSALLLGCIAIGGGLLMLFPSIRALTAHTPLLVGGYDEPVQIASPSEVVTALVIAIGVFIAGIVTVLNWRFSRTVLTEGGMDHWNFLGRQSFRATWSDLTEYRVRYGEDGPAHDIYAGCQRLYLGMNRQIMNEILAHAPHITRRT